MKQTPKSKYSPFAIAEGDLFILTAWLYTYIINVIDDVQGHTRL